MVSGTFATVKDPAPSKQDIKDAVDNGFKSLTSVVHAEAAEIKQLVSSSMAEVLDVVREFEDRYIKDKINDLRNTMQGVHAMYQEIVIEGLDRAWDDASRFVSKFDVDSFGEYLGNYASLANAPSRESILDAAVPAFVAARNELFAVQMVTCAREGQSCGDETRARYCGELKDDLQGFSAALDARCLKLPVSEQPSDSDFPAGCFMNDNPWRLDLRDLPRSATHLNFYFNKKITGDLRDLPRSATYLRFDYNEKITGDLRDLPRSATHLYFGSNEITGDLRDLPRSATHLYFGSNKKITGDLRDLPRSATHLNFYLNKKITGQKGDLPPGIWRPDSIFRTSPWAGPWWR